MGDLSQARDTENIYLVYVTFDSAGNKQYTDIIRNGYYSQASLSGNYFDTDLA